MHLPVFWNILIHLFLWRKTHRKKKGQLEMCTVCFYLKLLILFSTICVAFTTLTVDNVSASCRFLVLIFSLILIFINLKVQSLNFIAIFNYKTCPLFSEVCFKYVWKFRQPKCEDGRRWDCALHGSLNAGWSLSCSWLHLKRKLTFCHFVAFFMNISGNQWSVRNIASPKKKPMVVVFEMCKWWFCCAEWLL